MSYQIIDGIPVWGEPLQNAVDQMKNALRTAERGALMADHHLGYAVPRLRGLLQRFLQKIA